MSLTKALVVAAIAYTAARKGYLGRYQLNLDQSTYLDPSSIDKQQGWLTTTVKWQEYQYPLKYTMTQQFARPVDISISQAKL